MAAFLLWKLSSKAQFHFSNSGDPLPDWQWDADEDLWIVDFSYPAAVLEELAGKVNRIFVFDHHKTAAEALTPLIGKVDGLEIHFDMNRCGSMMLYDHLMEDSVARGRIAQYATYVAYVQDRDLWQWKLEGSREVSAYLGFLEKDFNMWDAALKDLSLHQNGAIGALILNYERRLVEKLVKNKRMITIQGHLVPSVNSPVLQSEIGEALSQGQPFAHVWFEREDGKVVHSLRASADSKIDVSEIAKQFGGGGHSRAAGYTSSSEDTLSLRLDSLKLTMLQTAGVDNWEWYGDALHTPGDGPTYAEAANAIRRELGLPEEEA